MRRRRRREGEGEGAAEALCFETATRTRLGKRRERLGQLIRVPVALLANTAASIRAPPALPGRRTGRDSPLRRGDSP